MCRYKKMLDFLSDGDRNKIVIKDVWIWGCRYTEIKYLYGNKVKKFLELEQVVIKSIDDEKIIYQVISLNGDYYILDKATNHAVRISHEMGETIK